MNFLALIQKLDILKLLKTLRISAEISEKLSRSVCNAINFAVLSVSILSCWMYSAWQLRDFHLRANNEKDKNIASGSAVSEENYLRSSAALLQAHRSKHH